MIGKTMKILRQMNRVTSVRNSSRWLMMALLMLNCLLASAQVRVVDAVSGSAVSYASVFDDATGKVLGITTSEGLLPAEASSCQNILVQHINYEPSSVAMASVQGGVIKMSAHKAYEVPEVAVNKAKHDYMRLKIYTRQYTIMNGVVAAVSESIDYGFYDTKKQKMKEELLLSQRLLRNESMFKNQPKWIVRAARIGRTLPGGDISDELKDIKKCDDGKRHPMMLFGSRKYWTSYVKHDAKANRIEYIRDSIFVDKPFNVKIMGVSLSDGYLSCTFNSAYGKPSVSTWRNNIFAMRITHNKTQSSVMKYIESYVLEAEYADKSDYKALRNELTQKAKSGSFPRFERPAGFPGFNKYVTNAMKSMKVVYQ